MLSVEAELRDGQVVGNVWYGSAVRIDFRHLSDSEVVYQVRRVKKAIEKQAEDVGANSESRFEGCVSSLWLTPIVPVQESL